MTTSYTDGTVTVTNGSATVTGNGTGWETANVSPGFFGVDGDTGNPVPVATIVSDTEMTLVTPWRGDGGAGLAYWLSYDTNDGQQTVNNAVRLSEYIARLDSEALSSIAALTPSAQRLIMFTGPNTATLIDRGDLGFSFDEQVPTLAERAAYDSAPADFVVLVIDNGDGRSAFYTKLSSASGDWSMPAYVTGPTGETGPVGPATEIQVGTVTTLPAGSSVTVVEREVSPGVVALDFGIPKGADGTGTGDVVGPNGGVEINDLSVFADTTGKLLKKAPNNVVGNTLLAQLAAPSIKGRLTAGAGNVEDLTPAQANQLIGGWEHITTIGVGGGSAVSITNLSAFYSIRITHRAIVTTGGYLGLQASTDNGATFLTSASNYGYTLIDNFYNGSTSTVTGGDGGFAPMPSGDESSSGVVTFSGFNAPLAAYAVGQILIELGSNRVLRNIGHRIIGTTPRNAMRITVVGGTFIHGVFIVEGVRS